VNAKTISILIAAKDHASSVFARAGVAAKGFGSSLVSLKGLVAGAIGGFAVGAAVTKAMEAWGEQEQASAKLAAVLKATGGAAGFTAKQLEDYATHLQQVTTFGDEATTSAMAILATFKNISGETFKEATDAMLDLSAAMGQDLKASALQVGKALNDPIKGITALRRVGVSFTQDQLNQITALVKTGKTLDAQTIILRELKSEFGGVAQAMAQTGTGAMMQFKNAVGELWEKIGQALTPAIVLLADCVGQAMPYISTAFEQAGNNLATACAYIRTALDGWAVHMGTMEKLVTVFVDTCVREFNRLHSSAVQDSSYYMAGLWETVKYLAKSSLGIKSAAEDYSRGLLIIHQSYRDYFSKEELDKLTQAELGHLKDLEGALTRSSEHFRFNLPKNLERFKFQPDLFTMPTPQPWQQAAATSTASRQSLSAVEARFLGRSPADDARRREHLETRRDAALLQKSVQRLIDLEEQHIQATKTIAENTETDEDEEIDF